MIQLTRRGLIAGALAGLLSRPLGKILEVLPFDQFAPSPAYFDLNSPEVTAMWERVLMADIVKRSPLFDAKSGFVNSTSGSVIHIVDTGA